METDFKIFYVYQTDFFFFFFKLARNNICLVECGFLEGNTDVCHN